MAGLRSLNVMLQDEIHLTDRTWQYSTLNAPKPSTVNARNLVKSISFVSSTKEQRVCLHYEPAPTNRVTRTEPLDNLLMLSFSGFRLREPVRSETEVEADFVIAC